MEIIRPDYQYSALVVYSLCGVELVFRLPQHYGNYPPVVAASDIDIHDHHLYQGSLSLLRYLPLVENELSIKFRGLLYLALLNASCTQASAAAISFSCIQQKWLFRLLAESVP